jgi:fucose permease
MTGLWSVAAVTCTAAFVAGMVLALVGSLKLTLANRLKIGEGRIGGLISALNLALIPMMLLSGILIDSLGVRLVLIVGALTLAVSVSGLGLRNSYLMAVLSIAFIGAGAAFVSASSVVLMPDAFGFDRDQLAASLNLGHVFFALGALITPTLTDLLLRTTDLRRTLAVLALVCLVPAGVATVSFSVPAPAGFDPEGQRADLWVVLRDRHIWLVGIAFLLYAPLEFAISTWGTTYLTTDQGYTERRAARLLSFFWLSFLAGRVLMTWVFHSEYLPERWAPQVIFVLALAASVVVGNLAGESRSRRAAWSLVLLGFVLGPIFPTLVAIAVRYFPYNRGTAYGTIFAIGSLGSLFLAPILGAFARSGSVLRALRLLAPLALLLVVAALAIWLTK